MKPNSNSGALVPIFTLAFIFNMGCKISVNTNASPYKPGTTITTDSLIPIPGSFAVDIKKKIANEVCSADNLKVFKNFLKNKIPNLSENQVEGVFFKPYSNTKLHVSGWGGKMTSQSFVGIQCGVQTRDGTKPSEQVFELTKRYVVFKLNSTLRSYVDRNLVRNPTSG